MDKKFKLMKDVKHKDGKQKDVNHKDGNKKEGSRKDIHHRNNIHLKRIELKKINVKELYLLYDFIIVIAGIMLMILLILVFLNPNNKHAFLGAFITGGFMNVMNGLKLTKDPKRKSMGMTFILFGIIIGFLGFIML
ncbi:hypothetical protein I5677_06065 [Mobilitalea sibirica]|uniref:Uncharacterized protein n=1 Tax=Mobilitalea sibirica TaxID=1462919 RepID=A0A8J7HBY0_9FIRM|nr:hypothetical protein [Mobilitalea sibirica]MBH1940462.1 hypothetical protein [Mobilitalea sibirica]